MVDYTTKQSGGGMWIYIVAAVLVLLLVYAIFAGGGASPTVDPSTLTQEPAATAPAAPATDTN